MSGRRAEIRRCFCACHEHPGTYWSEPCSVCGHFNSRGRFPQTVRDGWQAFDPVEDQPEGTS